METAYRYWMVLEATGWRWTLRQVMEQPERWLDRVMQIAGLGEKIKKQVEEGRKEKAERRG